MDVSVIFATHNRADVIADVLEAWREVHKNTRYEYEIICSDDASEDNTVELIRQATDLPITILENEKGGASKARNAALEIASGKIIIFTGDDMFPGKDFVNAHYENYLKFGANVATLGRIEWHEDLQLNHLMYHITNIGCEQFGFIGLPPYQLIDFRHFYTSNISVSKQLLERLERYFNTDFDKYGFEDIELGYRLEKEGMQIYYDPDIVITHHHIYDSVDKFCNRQMSAGEELVVFHQMHHDLADKCICDVENYRQSFEKYKESHSGKHSIRGFLLLKSIAFCKKSTSLLEKMIRRTNGKKLKKITSLIYAGVFKFYFFYGCAYRIAQNSGTTKSRIADFTIKYMKKGHTQIYWDTGYGFNESESRKWVCWDNKEWVIDMELPAQVKEMRLSPMKNQCLADIKEMYFVTDSGEYVNADVIWHNSCNGTWINGNYTHTNDPQIVIQNIASQYRKLVVKLQVKDMKKKSILRAIKNAAVKIYRKQEAKVNSKKEWEVQYASGQARKIQVVVGGLDKHQRKVLIEEYQSKVSVLGNDVLISDMDEAKRGYTDYMYLPHNEPLDSMQMTQVVYTLLNSNYDYILVSKSFAEYPQIACKCLDDVLIYSALLKGGKENLADGLGRYMRLPSFNVEENTVSVYADGLNCELENEFLLKKKNGMMPLFRVSQRAFAYQKKKPLVFVFPIFLAVGGVERNTIEVMRALKEEYDFVLVTMERHSMTQGSLHYQLKGICEYVFDLREITEFENYLDCLYELKEVFHPDAVWLCNNSPWFEAHTMQVRQIFKEVPIVAQDVYDTRVGWIEYYNNPGVKSFDRYIAVTELIRETFEKKYNIPNDKIDVIYSVVDGTKIREEIKKNTGYNEICKKYGLDENKEHYSFVGRLTEQKDPIRFLKLAEQVWLNGEKEMQFIMVGDGVYSEQVTNYIQEHSLEPIVMRIPYVANTPEFISALDGLILTSVYEGMPIVSIEAMSMSTPIFSTDTGDLKRFMQKTKGGMIIDEGKTDLENFMEFHGNLQQYKENARQYAEEMLNFFSADIQAKQYINTFERAMKSLK